MRKALLLLAALAGATAAGSAGSAAPAGSSPELVFARAGELYSRSPDGAVRRLTRNRVFDGFPAWSPDGSRIVFVRARGNDSDVWVADADGTDARRLAGSARGARDLYPRYSPDGKLIVFASDRGAREADLYVMRSDGTRLRRLTAGPRWVEDTQPSFSPDGRHVVFTSNRPGFFNHEIYRVRVRDGGGLTRLTRWGSGEDGAPGDDVSPSYSPDGKRIAFVSDRGGGYAVWTMDASGRGLREVARHRGYNVVFPRFTSDGRSLVYTAFGTAPGTQTADRLWAVALAGGGRRALGPGTAADPRP